MKCEWVISSYFIDLPMKMEPIVSSETSAIRTQTPGNYPKRNKLHVHSYYAIYTWVPFLLEPEVIRN